MDQTTAMMIMGGLGIICFVLICFEIRRVVKENKENRGGTNDHRN